jgi:hypothetical protein
LTEDRASHGIDQALLCTLDCGCGQRVEAQPRCVVGEALGCRFVALHLRARGYL